MATTHHQNTLRTEYPRVGILGGGQLASMLAQASLPLGITPISMVKDSRDALPGIHGNPIVGDWDVPAEAAAFARRVDLVTLENEFVNQASLEAIEREDIPLFPATRCIRLIQDKWHQKEALIAAGIPVVPCQEVGTRHDAERFGDVHGWPIVLKRRHMGYDGKGNATVLSADGLSAAWQLLSVNEAGLYAEAYCPFERELAVMVCRSVNGETAIYPVVDTVQRDHICHTVMAPSSLPPPTADRARDIAVRSVEAVGGQGCVGVEMFLTRNGDVLVNELAPRVHNSGHYTIEACLCSQFENHIRAILGLPLGSTAMIKPYATMINLLGVGSGTGVPEGLDDALRVQGARVHIYGKPESRKGRKMGHVTALGDTAEESMAIALQAADRLRFGS